jgi:anti-anti-sigma regulatory factor
VSRHLPSSSRLILDVTGAVLVDAAGLRALTAAQREAAALGKDPLVLRGVRPLLARTLHITGLDHLFAREPALAPTLTGAGTELKKMGGRRMRQAPARQLASVR